MILPWLFTSKIGNGLMIAVVAFGAIMWYNNMIETRALNAYNTKQLEQVIQDNEEFRIKMEEIAAAQDIILEDFRAANAATDQKFDFVQDGLSDLPGAKTESSQILKETIRRLQELQR